MGTQMIAASQYAECGIRYVMLPMPQDYDYWGYHMVTGERWEYSFCVVDDFGNLVPVDPFPTYSDGYIAFLAPNDDGVYTLQFETVQ